MTERLQLGILMIAHGSRRAAANQDLQDLTKLMEPEFSTAIFRTSFLELTTPTIPEGLESLIAAGAQEIVLFPYFLSLGVHVVEDLEEHRQHFAGKYPLLTFKIAPPLGIHPLMIQIVKDRLQSTLK